MRIKSLLYTLCVGTWFQSGYGASVQEQSVAVHALLAKTPYAVLLNEVIGLSDAVGLLRHRMQKDERRLIEDSILGRAVRVRHLLENLDCAELYDEDVAYLLSWLSLARAEKLPLLLAQQIAGLEDAVYRYAENVCVIKTNI